MSYVDGFVLPVPKARLADYTKLARRVGKVFREHGAIEYREWVADDVPPGKRTSFPRSVKLKPDEVVVISYIVYKSRKHRDRVMAKTMEDPRTSRIMTETMPFDTKRMFFGGFKTLVDV
ncbi:DUF1428 domain-containing protein [Rhodopseudomonas telluris]|uniref:DUF1428 domain-containing protein n=1 Tax=Rhodopseudomonas telluris TaxID=644215 RepID=A0ABV6ELE9_9BRAD